MKKVINYKVTGETWTKALNDAFEKISKNVKIDGFRPGKAPRNIFEKKYGTGDIIAEAADSLIDIRFNEIIKKDKIIPIVEPKVELVKADDNEFEVNFTFIVEPEFTIGEYKNLKVKKDKAEVTKEELDHQIHHILDRYAELVAKEGQVVNGDIAIIDFEGFKDGVPFEGGKGENYSLQIGSNSFIPGFEEALIGMKKDEEKDINLTFPEDYMAEDLKGKEVIFKVKIQDIKERVIPELDEDFFKDLDMEGVSNKEELEAMLKEELLVQKEQEVENKYIGDLLEKASKNMEIEIDEEIIDSQTNTMYTQFLDKMQMQGISEEIYLQYANITKEDILKDMRPEALRRVKYSYLLKGIANKENITPTDKEAEEEAEKMAKTYNMKTDELIKELGGLEEIKYDLRMRKAIEYLKEEK